VAVGIALMTQLRGDTSLGEMLPWMVVAGMGIGPSLAAFTIVVQNAAPFAQLGAATGALTFFRQVGGTVGLALGGTLFGSALIRELPTQMTAAGVPPEIASFAPSGAGSDFSSIGDLGAQILAAVPEQARAAVEPFVPNIVNGFNNAFSLAIGSALWIGVVAAIGATAATLFFLPELPLRTHHGPARAESAEAEGSEPAPMVAFD